MRIELIAATDADYPVVQQLSAYYIYDMSEFTGWHCPDTGRYGGGDEFFSGWRAGKNYPFLIRVDGELAGFAGVKYDAQQSEYAIQEFFVLRKFRRRGVGKAIAFMLFDRFRGQWKVQQLVVNTPAICFWQATINEYTNGKFECAETVASPWGELNTLR